MKLRRIVGQTALAGVIAFGGLGLGATADIPSPGLKSNTAEAATNGASTLIYDGWNGVTFSVMQENVARGGLIDSIITRKSYTNGSTLGGIVNESDRFYSANVMLYEITADGSLKRWKTILPNPVSSTWGNSYQYVTLINTVYPKGDYVAIHTYSWDNIGGETSELQEYKQFTIN